MIRKLPPASFAFVMATGIISTSAFVLGPAWLSQGLLVVAAGGAAVLGAGFILRVILYPSEVAVDARGAEKVFGFFTLVAGLDVVAVRLDAAGHPMATVALGVAALVIWLGLTYAVPAGLLLRSQGDSILGGVNGTWLLWVVGTQSLSIASSSLVHNWPARADLLAPVAAGLWGIGVVLYLMLVALILLRWLTVAMVPAALGPPYWILMGATAITVKAGAQFLLLPHPIPVRALMGGFVGAFSFVLWSFGTWWIPLLIILGFWRHLKQHWPLTYETALWSVVFPLGMYSTATSSFGKVAHLAFMAPIARVMLWVAVVAWSAVVAMAGVSLAGARRRVSTVTTAGGPRSTEGTVAVRVPAQS